MTKWIAIACFSVSLSGCKQGPGERCQSNEDCAVGKCSQSEPRTCGGVDQTQTDAQPPPDAPIDAPRPPIDAPATDAPAD